MTEEELRSWIRANVKIDVESTQYIDRNSVNIGLRFVGENAPFTKEHIYIPEDYNGGHFPA